MCMHVCVLHTCVYVYAGMFAHVGAHVEARNCLQDVFLHTSALHFCESVALTEPKVCHLIPWVFTPIVWGYRHILQGLTFIGY